jgi:DNA-binding MarR family transcriptional regulator
MTGDGGGGTGSVAEQLHSTTIRLLRWARVEDTALGLSAPRLSVLSVLVFGGMRTVTELASAEQVSAPTMTRLLQSLEEAGYVRRRRSARDGRVVCVTATAKGRRALERGRNARLRRIESVLARLPARERTRIERAVQVLDGALRGAASTGRG